MKILLSILFLTIFYDTCARIGMGEVIFNTPNGHQICDCDPYADTPVLIGYERTINSLNKWYFYRNHIVGQGKNYYFIFNEITTDLQYFNKKEEWERSIGQKGLEPFYTRWCDISDSPESFFLAIVLSSFIIVPIFLIALFVIIGLTYVKMIIWTKKTWIVTLTMLLIIGLLLLYRLNIHSF